MIDVEITGNDIAIDSYVDGIHVIKQRITDMLRTFLGEWFLNINDGVDYEGRVFVSNPNSTMINAEMANAVSRTAGVLRVVSSSVSVSSGMATFSYIAIVDVGNGSQGEMSGSVPISLLGE